MCDLSISPCSSRSRSGGHPLHIGPGDVGSSWTTSAWTRYLGAPWTSTTNHIHKILWLLAQRRQVDGTSRAPRRSLVRTESIARLYIFLRGELRVWCAVEKINKKWWRPSAPQERNAQKPSETSSEPCACEFAFANARMTAQHFAAGMVAGVAMAFLCMHAATVGELSPGRRLSRGESAGRPRGATRQEPSCAALPGDASDAFLKVCMTSHS